jgi:hypothetical protein
MHFMIMEACPRYVTKGLPDHGRQRVWTSFQRVAALGCHNRTSEGTQIGE